MQRLLRGGMYNERSVECSRITYSLWLVLQKALRDYKGKGNWTGLSWATHRSSKVFLRWTILSGTTHVSLSIYTPYCCLVTKPCPTLVVPGIVACQAPLSMAFPRQEYWCGLPFPSPVDLPNPGIKPSLLHCKQIIY